MSSYNPPPASIPFDPRALQGLGQRQPSQTLQTEQQTLQSMQKMQTQPSGGPSQRAPVFGTQPSLSQGNYSYQHQLPFTPMHLPVNPHAAQHLGQHQHPYGPRQATQSVRNCRGLSKSAAIRSDVSVRLIAQMQAIKGEFDPQEFEFYSDDDAMVGVQGIVEEILRRLDEERAKNRRLELQVRQLQSQMQQLQSSQTIQQQQPLQRSQGLYPTPYPIPEGANQFGRGLAHNPMSWEDQRRSWAAHHQRRAKLLAQALLPPSVAQPLLDANQRLMHQLTQQNDYGFGDNTTPDTNNGASSVKVEQSRGGDSSAQK